MRVTLTGHSGISGDDGTLIDAAGVGRLGRLAFAYLVMLRHRPVPREELADVLWGEALPRTWDTSLRVTISRLRTWLAAAGLDRAASLTSAFGCYQLHLPATAVVDVEEAAGDLAAAREALAAGDATAARTFAARASTAAAQELLPGVTGPWVEQEQGAWRDMRVIALEVVAEASLAGPSTAFGPRRPAMAFGPRRPEPDPGAALAAAEEAAKLEPLRESAHVLIIRALADLGNRPEALRVYERLRRLLAEELGISPSAATEATYLSVLREQPEASASPRPPLEAARPALPAALSSFVGREAELAELAGRLRSARLVTVLGTGGLGKTRLAVEVAARVAGEFADGAALVSLGEVVDPAGVPARAVESLGVTAETGRSPVETLRAALARRHLLLVVDNCEHVADAAGALVAALLAAAPRVVVLATSREPLRVPGEVAWRLSPLPPEEAAQLFVVRAAEAAPSQWSAAEAAPSQWSAAEAAPGNSPDPADQEALAALCRRLDGIPLAIELAAARAAMLSLPEIAARLDDRFGLLTGGARTAPARHQTLRATIDWSYDALPAGERYLFHTAGVFAGPFTLDAVAEVAGLPSGPALDALGALVARSLVVPVPSSGDPTRYRMLETLRAYAAERLDAAGEAEPAYRRLRAWAVARAEEAEEHLDGPDQAAWLDHLDADHANLLAALRGGGGAANADTLRLAAALGRFWEIRGHLQEGRDRLRAVLAEVVDAPPLLRARAENAAALLAQRQGDYAAARSRLEQSLSLRRQAGDRLGVAVALHGLGNLAALQHDTTEARRLYEAALQIGQEVGSPPLVAAALDNLGWVAHAEGDLAAARRHYELALAARQQTGDQHGIALALSHLGDLAYQRGDYAAAGSLHRESLQLRTQLGDQAGRADSLATLGHLAMTESLPEARVLLQESLAIRRRLGDRAALPNALANLADLALLAGDLEEARVHLKEAAAVAAAGRDTAVLAHVLVHHGRLALGEGRPDVAARRYAEARATAGELAADPVTAEWLEGVGATLAATGDAAAGARLLGAAGALREAIGAPVPPYERPAHDREVAAVRAAAGDADFDAGRTVPLDQAVDEGTHALNRASTPPGG